MSQVYITDAQSRQIVNQILQAQKGENGGLVKIENNGKILTKFLPPSGDFQGAAAPADNPGTPAGPVYYFATTSGTYTNFGGLVVDVTEGLTILVYDGSAWEKSVVPIDLVGLAESGYTSNAPTLKSVENLGLASNSFIKLLDVTHEDLEITAAFSNIKITLDKTAFPEDLKVSLGLIRRGTGGGVNNEVRFKYLNSSNQWVNLGVLVSSTADENINGQNDYDIIIANVRFQFSVRWSKIPMGTNKFLYGVDNSANPSFILQPSRILRDSEFTSLRAVNINSWRKVGIVSDIESKIVSAFTNITVFLGDEYPADIQIALGLVRRNISGENSFRFKYLNSSSVWVEMSSTFTDAFSNENINGVNHYEFTLNNARIILDIDWSKIPLGFSNFLFGGQENQPAYILQASKIFKLSDLENFDVNIAVNQNNLVSDIIEGVILQDGVESGNIQYWKTDQNIKVELGETYILFEKDLYQPIIFRDLAAYDVNGNLLPSLGTSQSKKYTVPSGVNSVRFSFFKSAVSTTEVYFSKSTSPVLYETPVKRITEISLKAVLPLKGKSILAYGDSITAGTSGLADPWLNILSALTGTDTVYNMAIGGANASVFSTRNESTNPYDWETSFPNTAEDTFNDRHLIPQIDHTPNTLRKKYDLISNRYLQGNGTYIFKPDIILIAIGFNDWKNSDTLNFESYNDVKDLNYSQLLTRASDSGIVLAKIFTYLRIAFEKLNAGLITENRDGITYGLDARDSKIFFVTPIQNANPFTYTDSGNVNHTLTLDQFGEYLKPILADYSIQRINGYADTCISWRYENVGATGRYLIDGIHPNIEGYKRIARLVASIITS